MMTLASNMCSNTPTNFVEFGNVRELGPTLRHKKALSELITVHRDLKPLIADTASNCRSTYLLRLNPTGKLLAAAHGDRSIGIYCASTGRSLARCVGHERSPWTLSFHPAHPYLLASGCLGGSIRLWNLEELTIDSVTENPVLTIPSTKFWKHAGAVASIAFHPVHPILVAAWTQEVVFYDWISGRKLSVWRFVSNQSRVRWVHFSPDGALLYTATANPSMPTPVDKTPRDDTVRTATIPPNDSEANIHQRDSSSTDPSSIARGHLLDFLISVPDVWFQRLGICDACSVRLCRWAGTLSPQFPPGMTVDYRSGFDRASSLADLTARSMLLVGVPLPHVIRVLTCAQSDRSDVSERIAQDPNPAAVAIIEDMPVQEFLRSRGNYCSQPSVETANAGLCCGGHACDLVLTHRELMRHSICRHCLTAFWRWASRCVDWWTWTARHDYEEVASCSVPADTYTNTPRSDEVMVEKPLNTEDQKTTHESTSQPAGICLQCKAVAASHSKLTPSECSARGSLETTGQQPMSNQRSLPLAALDLLRSRLSNANEVTSLTYMASDLIMDSLLVDYIRTALRSTGPTMHSRTVTTTTTDGGSGGGLPEQVVRLLERATTAHMTKTNSDSPVSKRRRLGSAMPFNAAFNSDDSPPESSSTSASNHSSYNPDEDPISLVHDAARLGRLLSTANRVNTNSHSWNRPSRVQLVSSSSATATSMTENPPTLKLFPYVTLGAQLLRPTLNESPLQSRDNRSNNNRSPNAASGLERVSSATAMHTQCDTEQEDGHVTTNPARGTMTACCRCGHIVPQTFPIDPQSSLSAVVCEKLVLCGSDMRSRPMPHPPGPISTNNSTMHTSDRISVAAERARQSSAAVTANHHHPSAQSTALSSNTPSPRDNSIMYLINRSGSDSMLSTMHRSITEVVSGLFVDMGEHGSANCLQDTTYRVCCWELNLSGTLQHSCRSRHHSPRSSGCNPGQVHSIPSGSIPPMPANVAVSYNTNSLVIPHARLFNDSSICLSPNGRMLAGFVVPDVRGRSNTLENSTTSSCSSSDTLLAVYRLQPKARRGQCLFARRFSAMSPVCLDFSPLGDYLVVGMATTRIPSAALPSSSLRRLSAASGAANHSDLVDLTSLSGNEQQSGSNVVPRRHTCVAQIFRLERNSEKLDTHGKRTVIRRNLNQVATIKHPLLLGPSSSPIGPGGGCSDSTQETLHRWHQLLLTTPSGISLNTIVWNPKGGLFYGTTKGLVVIMGTKPVSIILPNEPPTEESLLEEMEQADTPVLKCPPIDGRISLLPAVNPGLVPSPSIVSD